MADGQVTITPQELDADEEDADDQHEIHVRGGILNELPDGFDYGGIWQTCPALRPQKHRGSKFSKSELMAMAAWWVQSEPSKGPEMTGATARWKKDRLV